VTSVLQSLPRLLEKAKVVLNVLQHIDATNSVHGLLHFDIVHVAVNDLHFGVRSELCPKCRYEVVGWLNQQQSPDDGFSCEQLREKVPMPEPTSRMAGPR